MMQNFGKKKNLRISKLFYNIHNSPLLNMLPVQRFVTFTSGSMRWRFSAPVG